MKVCSRIGVLAAFALALAVQHGAPARAGTDIRDYFRSTLQHMVDLPEPALVSYTVTVFATGQSFYVSRDPESGDAEFGFAIGDALGDTKASWPVRVRAADATTIITLDGDDAVTTYPLFDATWDGAYRWLRYGFEGSIPATPTPSTPPSEAPSATPSPTPAPLGVIAVVQAINTGAYSVQDRGSEPCENGHLGRHIHLAARGDGDAHPATDLTVDTTTGDICTMRFELRRTQFFALRGSVEIHYERVGAYLLASDGRIRLHSDIQGVGRRRIDVSFVYSDIQASPK
ncbi:MAG TPA: hypothetical protein VNF68_07610 [Candidatus Baltobacteraceae bacterium]|nr:hypothetical protein [Candidatus Baltobacteraceae bacterium]